MFIIRKITRMVYCGIRLKSFALATEPYGSRKGAEMMEGTEETTVLKVLSVLAAEICTM